MTAKNKNKNFSQKALLPRDEEYILSLCSVMSQPLSKLFAGYTRCAVARTKLIKIFAPPPFHYNMPFKSESENNTLRSSWDPTSQSAVLTVAVTGVQ
jgi:hypothetical protein